MASKTIFFAASALAGAALVAAQAAPNWNYIPSACASQCSGVVESAYTCQNQFSGDSTQIYGCFCNNYPSDAATCATCLNDNNAAALGSLLTSTQTACPQAIQSCFFACSFDTCASSDIACQCEGSYLENIYNCASCNTANNNPGTTQISDFESLRDSCANQNFTGASQSFTTKALPVATTDGYTAPQLTATGGGVAATGDVSATEGGLAATGAGSAAAATGSTSAAAASSTSRAAGASSASKAATSGSARASGSASSASGSAAAAASSTGAALNLAAPALTGILGFAGAIAALL
ncbi:hypothetical protein DB88DRAFT_533791 [Papiliotrema laurentii]|uniref:Extracellular membrane protein CFEM domain-containing protein n=1 Tax=Papiliotrema laurentii TaxID=5418 RepID=A0AAD9FVR7_PAPLA|nr:hypothetical protein DB88DRAFT_533791 [Papiliotrema laurentii]